MELIIAEAGWLILSYIIGALPFGLIVAKACQNIDPRQYGSRNVGATNVARTCGTKYGILTLLLDVAKGFFPVFFALYISESAFFITLVSLAVLGGHMYSIFLSGHGGKGVATSIGLYLAIAPGPLLLALAICIVLIRVSGFISLGSIALVTAMPVLLLLSFNFSYLILALLIMALVMNKHKDNILRLAKGEEKTWRKKNSENDVQAGSQV